jgi:hypothetical protein
VSIDTALARAGYGSPVERNGALVASANGTVLATAISPTTMLVRQYPVVPDHNERAKFNADAEAIIRAMGPSLGADDGGSSHQVGPVRMVGRGSLLLLNTRNVNNQGYSVAVMLAGEWSDRAINAAAQRTYAAPTSTLRLAGVPYGQVNGMMLETTDGRLHVAPVGRRNALVVWSSDGRVPWDVQAMAKAIESDVGGFQFGCECEDAA